MTNLENAPDEQALTAEPPCDSPLEVIGSREVPLGGLRAMTVRRTLPHRSRSLIGAWCFADHYGPDDVTISDGMQVAPHPHTSLQTVTWLYEGEIEHRDSLGTVQRIRPGELNLMTAGRGISHSEGSPVDRPSRLHGVQLWTALPESQRQVAPQFEHLGDELPRFMHREAQVTVLAGSLLGHRAPTTTFSPLMGAEIRFLEPGTISLELNPAFEHGVFADQVEISIGGHSIAAAELGCIPTGTRSIEVRVERPTQFMLLGGEPFEEDIVMWWNFIGRSHEEVVADRDEWMAQTEQYQGSSPRTDAITGRFGLVHGFHQPPIPAPPLPHVRLRSRGNLPRKRTN